VKIAYMGVKGLPSKSGTERVIEAIINRLIVSHEITVYCDSTYTPKNTKIHGVRLIRIPTVFKGTYTKAPALDILSSLHAVFFGNYDVIHLNGVENTFILPFLRLKYRVVSTSHGSPGRITGSKWGPIAKLFVEQTEYPFLFLSNIATTISSADADYLEARHNKKIIYIPNGVDLNVHSDQIAAQLFLREHGIEPQNFILFAAGRIIALKGCHILIDAHMQIDSDIPLLIIGDLDQVPSYGKALKQMVSSKRVIFIPAISNRELLFGILSQCKLFVFPSTAESMSMMLLEAVSLDIPLICSDIEENTSVLGDSVLYFRSGDVKDLSNKIQYALNNPQDMESFAHKASELVKNHYSWDKIAGQYENLYKCCFEGKPFSGARGDANKIEKHSELPDKQ
jgi:glycosyltransferase involved in cell wall biosynthesis